MRQSDPNTPLEAGLGPQADRPAAPDQAVGQQFLRLPPPRMRPDPPTPVDFHRALGRAIRIRWETDPTATSALARASRELCLTLWQAADVELSTATGTVGRDGPAGYAHPLVEPHRPQTDAALSGAPDVIVRIPLARDRNSPASGKLVLIQPWDGESLPDSDGLEGAAGADEIWVYSGFARDQYVRCGVPAEKVRVVPLGVNADGFTPDGPAQTLPTTKRVRFLYAESGPHADGGDLLLRAYRQAFTRHDDVCLVITAPVTGTRSAPGALTAEYRQDQVSAEGPEVLFIDTALADAALATLYRACTCLVAPHQCLGCGLSLLEAMSCALPVIATACGPSDDYVDDTTAIRLPFLRDFPRASRGCPLRPRGAWHIEPGFDALVKALQWVHAHPEGAAQRGRAARARVAAEWSWARAAGAARERLLELTEPSGDRPIAPAVLWSEPSRPETSGRGPGVRAGKRHRPIAAGLAGARPRRPAGELSLCMIARDEEPRIGAALGSIAPFVDEMIVVDTGSTDGTREIARDGGARVFEFPWVDDFAAARNQSLEQARCGWAFWMDADDVITPECGRQLRELIRRHPARDTAFQVRMRVPPRSGEFSTMIVDHVKLFPNRPDLRFEHRIHEQILPALARCGIPVEPTELYVTHANRDCSPHAAARRRRLYLHLLQLELTEHPDHPFVLFNLGMAHLFLTQEPELAAHYLTRCLERSHWSASIVRKAYAMLAQSRVNQRDWEAALAANEQGRASYPNDAELLLQAGRLYQELGRTADARSALERLVSSSDHAPFEMGEAGLSTYRGWHELALLYRRLGHAPHAAQVLREVIADYPSYLPAWIDLVDTLYGLGRGGEARAALVEMVAAREARG